MNTTMTKSTITTSDQDFLQGAQGFVERYLRNLAYYTSRAEAYEATERQYIAIMGEPRYADYKSFRAAYSKFCARRKQKKAD